MNATTIKVLNFSDDPWGRDASENPVSNGEKFRKEWVLPAVREFDHVTVDFSDLMVIPDSSFLGEAFIGLVKKEGYSYDDVKNKITILPAESIYSSSVENMLSVAQREDNARMARLVA